MTVITRIQPLSIRLKTGMKMLPVRGHHGPRSRDQRLLPRRVRKPAPPPRRTTACPVQHEDGSFESSCWGIGGFRYCDAVSIRVLNCVFLGCSSPRR